MLLLCFEETLWSQRVIEALYFEPVQLLLGLHCSFRCLHSVAARRRSLMCVEVIGRLDLLHGKLVLAEVKRRRFLNRSMILDCSVCHGLGPGGDSFATSHAQTLAIEHNLLLLWVQVAEILISKSLGLERQLLRREKRAALVSAIFAELIGWFLIRVEQEMVYGAGRWRGHEVVDLGTRAWKGLRAAFHLREHGGKSSRGILSRSAGLRLATVL